MPKFVVICAPAPLNGEFEAEDAESAIDQAMDEWCPCLGEATDAVTAGSFEVLLVTG